MEDSIASALRRWLLVAGVLLVAGALCVEAGKHWLAEHWAHSPDPPDWGRAAELQPSNAGYWHRLGQSAEFDFEQKDLHPAILHYRRATELNPRSATYWLDLARAYETSGEADHARGAFERAKTAHPISSEVAWRFGSFLLRRGQLSLALAELRRSFLADPRHLHPALDLCWRASRDVELILDGLLPPESSFHLQALAYFISRQEIDPALATWNRFQALGRPFEFRRVIPLLNALIREDRLVEARDVWQQALAVSRVMPDQPGLLPAVWNGGFEEELLGGGFGWRKPRVAGASFDFDTTTARAGQRSLRITFDGSANLNFQHLVQYVLVKPHNRYRFEAFLRTEAISSDSGMRFRIYDPRRPASLDVVTPNLVGTVPWSLQEVQITTGPETRLLAIALRRLPSRKFDNKLQGSVWVDDVSLTPLGNPGTPRSP